jgi:hypothetical protein
MMRRRLNSVTVKNIRRRARVCTAFGAGNRKFCFLEATTALRELAFDKRTSGYATAVTVGHAASHRANVFSGLGRERHRSGDRDQEDCDHAEERAQSRQSIL